MMYPVQSFNEPNDRFCPDNISDATYTKDNGYFNSHTTEMIRRLQIDIENLRDRIVAYKQDDTSGRIYETIHVSGKRKPGKNRQIEVEEVDNPIHEKGLLALCLQENGFHHFTHVFDKSSSFFKRAFWCVILAGCLAVLGFNIHDRLQLFLRYPISSSVTTRPMEIITFPDVIICNLNTYRLTKTVSLGMYDAVRRTQSGQYLSPESLVGLNFIRQKGYVTYEEFLKNVSQHKADLIYSCKWRGKLCGHKDFHPLVTKYGLCHIFRPPKTERQLNAIDSEDALKLTLNVEQYEYVLGPKTAVGVRVFLSEPNSNEVSLSSGSTLSVGTANLVKFSANLHTRDVSSFGCTRDYSQYRCQLECQSSLVIKSCDCYMPHLRPTSDKYRVCNVKDFFTCVRTQTHLSNVDSPHCDCAYACKTTSYGLSVSTAKTSAYAAESFMRSLADLNQLSVQFKRARDMYHRFDSVIFEYDKQALSEVSGSLNIAGSNVGTFVENISLYEQNHEKQLQKLFRTVTNLNNTIQRHHTNFERMTHVAFIPLKSTLLKTLDQVSSKRLDNFWNMDENDVKSMVNDMIDRLDSLVETKEKMGYKELSILDDLRQGVVYFDKQLLSEYGQKYSEFRKSKVRYRTVIDQNLKYIDKLQSNIRNQREKLIKIRSFSAMKSQEGYNSLVDVTNSMKTLVAQDTKLLTQVLDTLYNLYSEHRTSILVLSGTMKTIGTNFSTTVNTIKNSLSIIQNRASSLRNSIQVLEQEINTIKQKYFDKDLTKENLCVFITSSSIDNTLQDLHIYVNKIKHRVENIRSVGDKLSLLIEPLGGRIIDFGNMDNDSLSTLFSWLRFPTVQRESMLLLSTLEETSQTINRFQNDLLDYKSSGALNAEFYQNNFLQMEISYKDSLLKVVTERRAYSILDLACDVGGLLALFLGASILSFLHVVISFGNVCATKKTNTRKYDDDLYPKRIGV